MKRQLVRNSYKFIRKESVRFNGGSPHAVNFLEEFPQRILRADVQVDLRGLEPVVAEDLLEAGGAHALLDAIHSKSMPLMPSSA